MAELLRLSLATLTFLVVLLLHDPANELFLSTELGADRILPSIGASSKVGYEATRVLPKSPFA